MSSGCASPRAQRPASADPPAWLPHPPTLTIPQRSPRSGGPTAEEYGGRAPCGSGLVVPACSVGWSGPGYQAKGGDAWWAAGRCAGPGRSASSPERGSTRPAGAAASPGPTTPVRAPRRPATGAAGRAASTAGRPTATATCRTWSTAPAAGGGTQPAVVGQGDGQAPHCQEGGWPWALTAGRLCRRGQLGWRHAARLTVMDLLPGPAGPTSVATGGPDPLRSVIWVQPDSDRRPSGLAPCRPARRGVALLRPVDAPRAPCSIRELAGSGAGVRSPHPTVRRGALRCRGAGR
jgi:hypothetical protein